MKKKTLLAAILTIAFIFAYLNITFVGHYSAPQPWKVIEQLVLVILVFGWYYLDKAQHEYRANVFLNIAVVALPIVAVPVYLFLSRGGKKGFISFLLFLGFIAAMLTSLFSGAVVAAL